MSKDCFVIRFVADELIELFNKDTISENGLQIIYGPNDLLTFLNKINNYSSSQITKYLLDQKMISNSIYAKIDTNEIFKY